MKAIDLAYRTMSAELAQSSLDDEVDTGFPLAGRFVCVPVKWLRYRYFDHRGDGRITRRYVGPLDDPGTAERVAASRKVKGRAVGRLELVSTLVREARLPGPSKFAGEVVRAMAAMGFLRSGGVLIGATAFRCYPGILEARFPSAAMRPPDPGPVRFHSVPDARGDVLPTLLEALRALDATSRAGAHRMGPRDIGAFADSAGSVIEVTADASRAEGGRSGSPNATAPDGPAARSIDRGDLSVRDPVCSLILHRSGVGVMIPAPERHAIHGLVEAGLPQDDPAGRRTHDVDALRAAVLCMALLRTRHGPELTSAVVELGGRCLAWRKALATEFGYVPPGIRPALIGGLAAEVGADPRRYGLRPSPGGRPERTRLVRPTACRITAMHPARRHRTAAHRPRRGSGRLDKGDAATYLRVRPHSVHG